MIGAKTDPSGVIGQIIDPVGTVPSKFRLNEVVDLDPFRVLFRFPGLSVVFVKTTSSFFIGVDLDDRLALRKILFRPLSDVFEPGIPVRVISSSQRLHVGLKAVPHLFQKRSDRRMAHGVSQSLQFVRKTHQTLGRLSERRLRIPSGLRFDQRFKRVHERRMPIRDIFPSSSRVPNPPEVFSETASCASTFLNPA